MKNKRARIAKTNDCNCGYKALECEMPKITGIRACPNCKKKFWAGTVFGDDSLDDYHNSKKK